MAGGQFMKFETDDRTGPLRQRAAYSTEAWRPVASLGTSPRSEDRFKNVRGQKADHGDGYAVADQASL
jgi:hypothetical protein